MRIERPEVAAGTVFQVDSRDLPEGHDILLAHRWLLTARKTRPAHALASLSTNAANGSGSKYGTFARKRIGISAAAKKTLFARWLQPAVSMGMTPHGTFPASTSRPIASKRELTTNALSRCPRKIRVRQSMRPSQFISSLGSLWISSQPRHMMSIFTKIALERAMNSASTGSMVLLKTPTSSATVETARRCEAGLLFIVDSQVNASGLAPSFSSRQ